MAVSNEVVTTQDCIYALFPTASHFTLKMEAAWSFKMLVSYHNTTWHQNPEEINLDLQCRENLKF
jgi:hypothetical protein